MLRLGILGCSSFALETFAPAVKRAENVCLHAIASRDAKRAQMASNQVFAETSYGSYEELINDEHVDIVYIPLPNHMHAEWSLRAIRAGKHVLCEKPISAKENDVEKLIEARDEFGVVVAEGFMVFSAPQWLFVKQKIDDVDFGVLRAFSFFTSYMNNDPNDIRNSLAAGGGSMAFIGCYPIALALWFWNEFPNSVLASFEIDAEFGTDRQASAILQFDTGQAVFTVSNRMTAYQRAQLFGDHARIDIMVPCTPPADTKTLVRIDGGAQFADESAQTLVFDEHDQYRLEIEAFADSILTGQSLNFPLERSLDTVRISNAIRASAETGKVVSFP